MPPNAPNQLNVTQLPDIKEAYPLVDTNLLSSEQWTFLWIALSILFALCLSYAIYKWMKRPEFKPTPTPLERAWARLNHAEELLDQGTLKAFSQKVSLALREYIQSRHRIPALELTTEEFANMLNQRPYLNEAEVTQLTQILRTCDTLKFSTLGIDNKALKSLLEEAKTFLRAEPAEDESAKS